MYCDGQPGAGASSCRKMASVMRQWLKYSDGIAFPANEAGEYRLHLFRNAILEMSEHLAERERQLKRTRNTINKEAKPSGRQVTMFGRSV